MTPVRAARAGRGPARARAVALRRRRRDGYGGGHQGSDQAGRSAATITSFTA
ncbi:hypothetical protein [Microbispora sp. NPDC049125]|uniref:hypothetical protein n=1 Tax=Microbispora sp. NPDC049125 TaxID=3154929 RepID=UPI003466543B